MEFKDKIKGLVAENNMTQRSFAKEIDMEYGYVNKFFTGRTPNMDFLMKVLEVFPEVDLNWLLREEKIPSQLSLTQKEKTVPTKIY